MLWWKKNDIVTVKDLPSNSDFQFTFTPNTTTLFRFSALTFNGHQIHLDKDFAQQVEGYPGSLTLYSTWQKCSTNCIAERLVHAPRTALRRVAAVKWHHP